MNIDKIRANLKAQGLSDTIINGMLKSLNKPVKEKTAKRWFPGTGVSSAKVEKTIEVTVVCECCGAKEIKLQVIKATADSNDTMRLPVAMCQQCPDYFRAMDHETLVSLCLVRRHAGLMHQHQSVRGQVAVAKTLTPEAVIALRTNHF